MKQTSFILTAVLACMASAPHLTQGEVAARGIRATPTSHRVVMQAYPVADPMFGGTGGFYNWYYVGPDGVDVDEDVAARMARDFQTGLEFVLPDDATITLKGMQMTGFGELRRFVIPMPDADREFLYEIRIDVLRDGIRFYKKGKLKIKAGRIIRVVVQAPGPGEIQMADEVLAEPPAADDETQGDEVAASDDRR